MKYLLLALLLLNGCASLRRQDAERLGDDAWSAGRYADAVSAYRSAGDTPRLLAKRADAALLDDDLLTAIDAWTRMGLNSPGDRSEAGAGLLRVVASAQKVHNQRALTYAVVSLRRVVPEWPIGRAARDVTGVDGLGADELMTAIPAVLATVTGSAGADRLLESLASAQRRASRCDLAVRTLQTVLRHREQPDDPAVTNLAECELILGLAAMDSTRFGEAERWLDRAASRDAGAVGRRARIGLGDAYLREGDLASASAAWEAVASAPVAPDSLTLLALEKLRTAVVAQPLDSAPQRPR